jgi:hypothetical protein
VYVFIALLRNGADAEEMGKILLEVRAGRGQTCDPSGLMLCASLSLFAGVWLKGQTPCIRDASEGQDQLAGGEDGAWHDAGAVCY